MTHTANDGSSERQQEEILRRLASLEDLFRRRLLDDRGKNRAIETLSEDLRTARAGMLREYLLPFVRSLLLIIDRIDAHNDESPFAASLRDELLEALHRQGVEEVAADGAVDPAIHEVVAIEGDKDVFTGLQVAARLRRGFHYQGYLLRPARIRARVPDGCSSGSMSPHAKEPGDAR